MRDPTGSEAHCTAKNKEGVDQESKAVQRTNLWGLVPKKKLGGITTTCTNTTPQDQRRGVLLKVDSPYNVPSFCPAMIATGCA